MPSTVETLSPTRVKLTIEMPFTDLKPALDRAYAEIASQVSVPGFRKGKVPAAVIDQRVGRGTVLQQAINDALPQAYSDAINENNLVPLGQPEVDITKLEDGELVEFTAEVDVRPEFDLPDFSTVKVEVDPVEVTDEQVDERVQLMRERFATTTEVDRAAADGDVVTLDLVATQDGAELEEGNASDVNYRVGSGGMVDGLDEAVIGLKAGQSATFATQLVGGAHSGEDADITVTVTKVSEQELPAVDDDFAQLVSEFDTVGEMLADLKDNLVRLGRLQQASSARDKVLETVIESIEFDLPENLITSELEARHAQINQQLTGAGLTLDQYLRESEDETFETAEDFWADIDKRAVQALRAQIVLDKLTEVVDVQVNQQDLTQLIFAKAQQNGTTPEQEVQHMMDHNHMPEWMQEVKRSKALASMVNDATITDTNGEVVDLTRLQQDGTVAEPVAETAEETTEQPSETQDTAEPAEKPARKSASKAASAPADATFAQSEAPAAPAPGRKATRKSTEEKAAGEQPDAGN